MTIEHKYPTTAKGWQQISDYHITHGWYIEYSDQHETHFTRWGRQITLHTPPHT
jgi:hypothetical protein